jgi:thiol-disulfide isomerase/thioredoxin
MTDMPDDSDEDLTLDVDTSALPLGHPRNIGPYAIRRLIDSGGMGNVYEGIQENPRRPVAIKVMRQGVTSAEALRRFEIEAQLLARLRHPAIAQVYEAGTHQDPSGPVPYFAMEYIPAARTITDHAQENGLDTAARLDLFATVCDAVHHGHQKGIIHRDLKPGNILVDSSGRPKVIDFGVARATDSDLTLGTLQTSVGQLVGTLPYMSPEQCEADPNDIDTRSDVYSLGVVLYQLLTGELPYDLSKEPLTRAAKRIREEEPQDPSQFVAGMPRDLKTILLKALEKSRDRRYQSAYGLAQDIRRYRRGESIVARSPSVLYQLTVLARRNKALIGAAVGVFIALAVGAAVSTTQYFRAKAAGERAQSEKEAAIAALDYVREMLFSVDPTKVGNVVKVGDVLDAYGKTIASTLPDNPEIEAAVRTTIGRTYVGLDLFEKGAKAEDYKMAAREHLRAALDIRRETLGEDAPATLETMDLLADTLEGQERWAEAEILRRDAFAFRERSLGPDDPATIAAKLALANHLGWRDEVAEATQLAEEVYRHRVKTLGETDPATLEAREDLAGILHSAGEQNVAEQHQRAVFEQRLRAKGDDDDATFRSRGYLADMLLTRGELEESKTLYESTAVPAEFEITRWFQGETTPDLDKPTLLVFWEVWCPYSQKELPKLEQRVKNLRPEGLQVIGFTRTKGVEDRVPVFLEQKEITFPNAQIPDDEWHALYGRGVPSGALLHDGRVAWVGHPGDLDDRALALMVRK